jgi:hypothetical protein
MQTFPLVLVEVPSPRPEEGFPIRDFIGLLFVGLFITAMWIAFRRIFKR